MNLSVFPSDNFFRNYCFIEISVIADIFLSGYRLSVIAIRFSVIVPTTGYNTHCNTKCTSFIYKFFLLFSFFLPLVPLFSSSRSFLLFRFLLHSLALCRSGSRFLSLSLANVVYEDAVCDLESETGIFVRVARISRDVLSNGCSLGLLVLFTFTFRSFKVRRLLLSPYCADLLGPQWWHKPIWYVSSFSKEILATHLSVVFRRLLSLGSFLA